MVQDCPIIPLYQGSAYAVTSLGITGVFLDMTQFLRYWLICLDTTGPNITDVSQIPPGQTITQDDKVAINATISDQSGVKQATLMYSYLNSSGGPWIEAISMAHLAGDIWNATIPAYPQGTSITYAILAEDNVGNTITTQELGYYYQYSVIPEFPSVIVALLGLAFVATMTSLSKKRFGNTALRKSNQQR
jgi:hypothetical protein